MSTPDLDVVDFLNVNIDTLTKGTNLFAGPEGPADDHVPHLCVFCLKTGGFAPEAIMGSIEANHIKSVQIMIRGNKGDDSYVPGQELADSIRDSFLGAVNVSGYFDTRIQETEPNYLGMDMDTYHRWSLNVLLYIKE